MSKDLNHTKTTSRQYHFAFSIPLKEKHLQNPIVANGTGIFTNKFTINLSHSWIGKYSVRPIGRIWENFKDFERANRNVWGLMIPNTRWFKVTFWKPKWRSPISPLKRSRIKHPKRVTNGRSWQAIVSDQLLSLCHPQKPHLPLAVGNLWQTKISRVSWGEGGSEESDAEHGEVVGWSGIGGHQKT